MGSAPAANISFVTIIASPSLFAGQSASNNIEAQDKDRTVNIGHHIGRLNLAITTRGTTSNGIVEYCVFKVERQDATPTLGNFPIPSSSEVATQGLQQACRLQNPGKVFHFSQTAFATHQTTVKNIVVSPAKYRLSKFKAGDHWILMIHNRSAIAINIDVQMRYKEYE